MYIDNYYSIFLKGFIVEKHPNCTHYNRHLAIGIILTFPNRLCVRGVSRGPTNTAYYYPKKPWFKKLRAFLVPHSTKPDFPKN